MLSIAKWYWNYTKYDIRCHLAFFLGHTTVTFLVTLSMNGFTNTAIPTYFQFIQIPIIVTKFGIICNLRNLWWNIVMDDWKSLSKWQYLQHYKSTMPKFVYKEWHKKLG